MLRRLSLPFGSAILATTLVLTPAGAHHPGDGGGYHHGGGGFHYGGYYYPHHGYAFYGPYRPGLYAPYGFYRPYGGALALGGLGLGLGLGLGYGLGSYGMGGGYGMYRPYYGGTTIVNPTTIVVPPPVGAGTGIPPTAGIGIPPVAGTGVPPVNQTPPPPDNAAHLQLLVPQNAEVLFNGDATTQSGPTREFVSPPLTAGKSYDYTILVRYPDADGKPVTDRRVIHVRANDWFRVDFTHPAPPEPFPAGWTPALCGIQLRLHPARETIFFRIALQKRDRTEGGGFNPLPTLALRFCSENSPDTGSGLLLRCSCKR